MRMLLMCFLISVFVITSNAQGYYQNNATINVQGSVDVYEHADPQQIIVQKKELELKRKKLELQKKNDRLQWELQIKERDEFLQSQALLKNDGKCIDYFCEKRCQKRASNGGYCAKHFRENQKGLKEDKYKMVSRAKFFN